MPKPRDNPDQLSRRQAEWLRAVRDHYDRTGTAASRRELSAVAGCTSEGAAAYALEVLVAKGHLVRVYNSTGARRYLPADRVGGDGGKVMTVDEVIKWLRQADDQKLSLPRTEIEVEVIRRGVRATGRRQEPDTAAERERIATELEDDQEDDGDDV